MALATGSQFGAYQILAVVGAGGMGQVYRARDTKLNREVALKVLPDAFLHDRDRLARFEREAHVLASLNHPNVAHIYGIEEAGGIRAIVMELVSGDDLSARISHSPIAVPDALSLARQVAAALEAAHELGVIHRDLKPANIKVRDDGTVKVLDFGLAKALDSSVVGRDFSRAGEIANSPTITTPAMTAMGMILGTAAYMAPEQARGKPVDRRADIWAFGVVLAEMLTGRAAFAGDEVTDVLARVIERDPDLAALPAATPPSVRRLLARCLTKDPKQRLRDIGEARIALDEAARELERGPEAAPATAPAPTIARRALGLLPWGLAAALAAIAAWLALAPRAAGSSASSVVRMQVGLPAGIELYSSVGRSSALSPDGSTLCLIGVNGGVREVYLRRLDRFETTLVPGTSPALSCFFSPDGRSLGVIDATSTLKRVSLADGLVETVLTGVPATARGTWTSDNRIVFTRDRGLWAVSPVAGSVPVRLLQSDGDIIWIPVAIPGRDAVIFSSSPIKPPLNSRIELLSLRDGTRRVLVEHASLGLSVPTGHLLFVRDGALLVQPFDLDKLELSGSASVVLKDASFNAFVEPPALDVSTTGTLLYAPGSAFKRSLVWVSRLGVEQPLFDPGIALNNPRLTRNDEQVIVEDGAFGLHVRDFARQTFTRITASGNYPVLTPDRRRMVYRTGGGLVLLNLDGSGQPEPLEGTTPFDYPSSVSPDGKSVLFTRINADGAGATDTYASGIDPKSPPRPLLAGPSWEGGAQISPDGKWILYASDETGRIEIYLQSYPALSRKVSVSSGGGLHPLWNSSGTEIYFRNGSKMMVVSVSSVPDLKLSEPRVLFDARYAFASNVTTPNYAVAADGRFLMVKDDPQANRVNVVVNWINELTRPAGR